VVGSQLYWTAPEPRVEKQALSVVCATDGSLWKIPQRIPHQFGKSQTAEFALSESTTSEEGSYLRLKDLSDIQHDTKVYEP